MLPHTYKQTYTGSWTRRNIFWTTPCDNLFWRSVIID